MLASSVQDIQRQTYYTSSSNIGSASGSLFLDAFRKAGQAQDGEGEELARHAFSSISVEFYNHSKQSIAFSVTASGEGADAYYDDAENVYEQLVQQYNQMQSSGLTNVTMSEAELQEIAQILARVSAFARQDGTEAFYGESNAARYTLSSGAVIDFVHEEMVVCESYDAAQGLPAQWSQRNPLAGLPGFEGFLGRGYESVNPLPPQSGVDDDDTEVEDPGDTGDDDEDDTGGEPVFTLPADPFSAAVFQLIRENTGGIEYNSEAAADFSVCLRGLYNEMQLQNKNLEACRTRFDGVMPYIVQAISLCEEPQDIYNACKSVDSLFDSLFLNSDYSVRSGPNDAFTAEIRQMRGDIDTQIKALKRAIDNINTYNDNNPLDPLADPNDVDPEWTGLMNTFNGALTGFFAALKVEVKPVDDFIAQHVSGTGGTDDTGEEEETPTNSPLTGVQGALHELIRANPQGIVAKSAAETKLTAIFNDFLGSMYDMKYAGTKAETMLSSLKQVVPFLNKAASLCGDYSKVASMVADVQKLFADCFLEYDQSIPKNYEPNFAAEVRNLRGTLKTASTAVANKLAEMENYKKNAAVGQLAGDAQWLNLNAQLKTLSANFYTGINTRSYEMVLEDYAGA